MSVFFPIHKSIRYKAVQKIFFLNCPQGCNDFQGNGSYRIKYHDISAKVGVSENQVMKVTAYSNQASM